MEHRGNPSGGNELGDFLHARRAALDPRQAGFADDGRLRRVPGLRREELAQHLMRLTFRDHAYRALYADWPCAVRDCVAVLRKEAGRHPDDPALTTLVGELSVRDPDVRTWWSTSNCPSTPAPTSS